MEDFNLSIEKGQTVSIISSNASGKSSILKAVAGILKPESGSIYIEGCDISTMNTKELAKKSFNTVSAKHIPRRNYRSRTHFFRQTPA